MDNSLTSAIVAGSGFEQPRQPGPLEQAQRVWSACLDMIRERVNSQSFKTWFEPIIPQHLQGGTLTVQVPSQFFYDWLEEHYYGIISATITKVLGTEARLEYGIRAEETPMEAELRALAAHVITPGTTGVCTSTRARCRRPLHPARTAAREDAVSSPFPNYLNPALHL